MFPSMHVASGDRFVSFKSGGDRRDDNFLFLSRGVSHGRKGGVLLDLCQLFSSMHGYCFLPYMWHQVIDLFPLKQAGIAGMTFFFYRAGYHTGWTDGRTKINVAPKDVRALFFLVVEDYPEGH